MTPARDPKLRFGWLSRRHSGCTQEAPRRLPGSTQENTMDTLWALLGTAWAPLATPWLPFEHPGTPLPLL